MENRRMITLLIVVSILLAFLVLLGYFTDFGLDKKPQKETSREAPTPITDNISKSHKSQGKATTGEGGDVQVEKPSPSAAIEDKEQITAQSECMMVRPGNAPIIGCTIYSAKTNEILLGIKNQVGESIDIASIEITGCSGKPSGHLDNNQEKQFRVDGCSNDPGSFEGDLILAYQLAGSSGYANVGGKIVAVIK